MLRELARAAFLLGSVVLLGGTAVGAVRALLGLTPWRHLVLPGLACLALLLFVARALRSTPGGDRG